jgi:hypothetical protein
MAKLIRSPFGKNPPERAQHLNSQRDNPRAIAEALSQGGLLALATGDPASGKLVRRAVERWLKS